MMNDKTLFNLANKTNGRSWSLVRATSAREIFSMRFALSSFYSIEPFTGFELSEWSDNDLQRRERGARLPKSLDL